VANPANYDPNGWKVAYLVMAASMIVGFITVLFTREPVPRPLAPTKSMGEWLQTVLVEPFADFFRRYGWNALLVLALIATYRVSDIVMGIMAPPFYVDMGYSKDEVAAISKIYGVIMTLVGALLAGVLSVKIGVMRTLMLGAVLSAASNVLFSWLATRGHDVTALTLVISIDNLSSGIAATSFIAYMSSLTNINYTASQYAMLSSMMLLLPKWLAGFSGVAVDAVGYHAFFIGTAVIGVPVLFLIWLASRRLEHKASAPKH
jgi:PAT family beta-lactamase induction signal transducer AmpG